MIYFPTICVDDFFPYPDQLRNYLLTADNLNWAPAPDGAWPGIRSDSLHKVNFELFKEIASRYLLLHYSSKEISEIVFEAEMRFQRINVDDKKYTGGWIHNDYPYIQTTLIYLTPNAPLNSGTCLYRMKNLDNLHFKNLLKFKNRYPAGTVSAPDSGIHSNKISYEEVEKDRIKNNNQFEKTVYFSNTYNRCISFDSTIWHGVEEFSGEEDRLTLIIFWIGI